MYGMMAIVASIARVANSLDQSHTWTLAQKRMATAAIAECTWKHCSCGCSRLRLNRVLWFCLCWFCGPGPHLLHNCLHLGLGPHWQWCDIRRKLLLPLLRKLLLLLLFRVLVVCVETRATTRARHHDCLDWGVLINEGPEVSKRVRNYFGN